MKIIKYLSATMIKHFRQQDNFCNFQNIRKSNDHMDSSKKDLKISKIDIDLEN